MSGCDVGALLFSSYIHLLTSVAVAVTRAFTTSQSAEAHFILFQRIFSIASADTGMSVAFRHIDGHGFDSFVADGHKGQALGKPMSFLLCLTDVTNRTWNVLCFLVPSKP